MPQAFYPTTPSRSTISSLASTAVRQSLRTLLSPASTTISSRNAGQELGMVSPELCHRSSMRPGTTTRANRAMTEDYQQQERRSRIRYGVTGTRRIRHGVTGTVVSPELGHRHLGLCVLSPVRYGSHFQHVIIRRCPRNLSEMRLSIRSCKTSFDIGYRLRWRNPLGGREPASSQRSWPALLHGGRVARRGRCASASFQPRNRWQNLEESWRITGISRFFALAAFLA